MQSKLTLIGLYNYDNTVLDLLSFPEGIDKQLAISTILLRCGEFELLYPSLPFVKSLCDVWSKKHYRTFDKWITALNTQYNPLDNYNRHEEYTDTRTGSDTHSGQDSTTGSTTPAQTTTTATETVSAFDSGTYQPKAQNTDSYVVNVAGSDSSTITHGEIISRDDELTHEAHMWGNIGITSSQKMLTEELEVSRFSLYDQIADIFCEEFCLMIY